MGRGLHSGVGPPSRSARDLRRPPTSLPSLHLVTAHSRKAEPPGVHRQHGVRPSNGVSEQEGGLPPAAGWVDLEDLVLRHCAEDKRGAGPCPRGPGVPDPDAGRRRSQGWGAEGSEGSVGSEVQAGTRGKFWRRWWRRPHSVTTLHASTHLQWLQRCILYHNTKKCPQKSQAGRRPSGAQPRPPPSRGGGEAGVIKPILTTRASPRSGSFLI